MTPLPHQIEASNKLWKILVKNKYAYLAGKPRVGKSLTALLTVEKSKTVKNVLILCPKGAIPGWKKTLEDSELSETTLTKNYTVTNYEQVGSFKTRKESKTGKLLKYPIKELVFKLNPDDYQIIIIDESHVLGKLGKSSNRYKVISEFCKDKPHIHLSGTAVIESPNSIYYQMHLGKYSPFEGLNSFYDYFSKWGVHALKYIGREEPVNDYSKAKAELLEYIDTFTIYMTQEDAGIEEIIQAIDHIHYIELDQKTKDLYNTLQKDRLAIVQGEHLVCDSTMKLRTSLHMLENGTVKIDDE